MLFDDVDSDKLSKIDKATEITARILFLFACLLAIGLTIYVAIR